MKKKKKKKGVQMATKDQYKSKLKECNTLKDIFTVTDEFYTTDQKLGTIVKGVIILNIDKLISASGVKLKP